MSIATDFFIDADNRIIRHYTGSTVYQVNDLYSYIQDYFDELTLMTTSIPMTAQTPTEYSLVNGWFIPEETYKYLYFGAVKTIGWDTALYPDGVDILNLSAIGYVSCIESDIGKIVSDGINTGVLLDYNNTLRKWWVRRIDGLSGAIFVVSGTGGGSVSATKTGESLYTNVYTLGSLSPTTVNTLYVEQINPELTNNQITQYWTTGHIDLIVKVKEADVLINNGLVKVYCREYTDLYSHFAIDLSSGGRNPVPLGTLDDSNNQTSAITVAGWNDVTVVFGSITRDLLNGNGLRPYDIEIDCGGRTSLAQVYERTKLITSRNSGYTLDGKPGQFYSAADPSYAENTSSPFGTYAGGQFFSARGIFLKNVPAEDINSYTLADSDNQPQFPPYLAAGTFVFDPLLVGPNSYFRLIYVTVPGANNDYGEPGAVTVEDAYGNQIAGTITSSTMNFSYDYDANDQAGFTPGTDRNVILTAINPGVAKIASVTGTLSRNNQMSFVLDTLPDNFYISS